MKDEEGEKRNWRLAIGRRGHWDIRALEALDLSCLMYIRGSGGLCAQAVGVRGFPFSLSRYGVRIKSDYGYIRE